eukprot:9483622-Pyramimonas_sp.AAC.1
MAGGGLLPGLLLPYCQPPVGTAAPWYVKLAPAEPIGAENIRSLVWLGTQGSGRIGRGWGGGDLSSPLVDCCDL